jgi:curved DNA-binding protein CbpA
MTWEEACQILGVSLNASNQEIKEAWLFKVRIFHPDRLTHESGNIRKRAEDEVRKINQAYDFLKNPLNKNITGRREAKGQHSTEKPTAKIHSGDFFMNHKWHEIDFDELRDWVKKERKKDLVSGREIRGKVFIYRYNQNTSQYEIRLRHKYNIAQYKQ